MTSTANRPEPIFVTPRSRLKLLKKKCRSIAKRITTETESQVSSILESRRRRISAEPASNPNAETAVSLRRRKVEWQTPDDDIPSVADAMEAQPEVGLTETFASTPDSTPEPPATKKVNTVESLVAPLIEALPYEVVVEATVVEEIVPEIPRQIQHAIEPSNQNPIKPAPVVHVAKEAFTAPITPKPSIRQPAPAVRATQKPKMPATVATGRIVPRMDADSVTPKRPPQKPARQRSGLGFKVNLADLEEITLVRPPSKRIKIDWERAVPVADAFKPQPRKRQATAPRRGRIFADDTGRLRDGTIDHASSVRGNVLDERRLNLDRINSPTIGIDRRRVCRVASAASVRQRFHHPLFPDMELG